MATWQHLRSSTANKRPTTSLADGRIAINTNTASPGLFFKDSAGTGIVKVGPVHVGTTAPNATPAVGGSTGNYTGEQWLDTSVSPAQMKVWNGSTWVGVVADELPVSKLQDGAARQLIQTDAAGTGVEWTSNVDVPGTLDVTSTATFDSIAQHPVGSAGAPTLTFTGDTNTGIYSPGADQVAISTGGSGRLFVDANGNIAIGTSATSNFGATARSFDINSAGGIANLYVKTGTVNGGLQADAGNGYMQVWTASNHPIAFNIAFSEKMRLDTSGRLGIGTSSPTSAKLDVRDDVNYPIRWGSTSAQFGELSYGTGECVIGATSGNKLTLRSAGTAAITIDTSQRVGIGTTTPTTLLEIKSDGTAANEARLTINEKYNASDTGFGVDFKRTYDTGGDAQDAGYIRMLRAGGNTNGGLTFGVGDRGAVSERLRIDSSGRLLVGTSTAVSIAGSSGFIQQHGNKSTCNMALAGYANNLGGPILAFGSSRSTTVGTAGVIVNSGDILGDIRFAGDDGTDINTTAATIRGEVDGAPGFNDMPGRLVFSTTADGASIPTERMRITQDGRVLIGTTNTSPVSANVSGTMINSNGEYQISRDNATPLLVNRKTSDGNLVEFWQDGTIEGSISVSGTTVSYNGAHLSRWSQLPSGAEREEILRGTVLSNIDEMCEWGEEENEQLNRMKVSDVEGDKNVSGVFQAWDDDDDTYTNDFYCAMTGDFIIRIAEGVTVERGDLLMSAGDGTAKPQDDDIIRSKTIAKVTSTNVSCTYEDGSYCVPCVLMAC
jgi:hypothetical protein